ncbi:hypothetical protein ACJX0J_035265, partial [Zea mays]
KKKKEREKGPNFEEGDNGITWTCHDLWYLQEWNSNIYQEMNHREGENPGSRVQREGF